MSKKEIITCDICDQEQGHGLYEYPYAIKLVWTGRTYDYHICRNCHQEGPKKAVKSLWKKLFHKKDTTILAANMNTETVKEKK